MQFEKNIKSERVGLQAMTVQETPPFPLKETSAFPHQSTKIAFKNVTFCYEKQRSNSLTKSVLWAKIYRKAFRSFWSGIQGVVSIVDYPRKHNHSDGYQHCRSADKRMDGYAVAQKTF